MSSVSFISFPRRLDFEMVKRIVPKYTYTAKEIRDMKILETNTSYKNKISDEDFEEYIQLSLPSLTIYPEEFTKPTKTFRNKYYYGILGRFSYIGFDKELGKELMNLPKYDLKKLEKKRSFIILDWGVYAQGALCRQQLYNVINESIEKNEFVEMYSHWLADDDSYVFEKPREVVRMNLDELITPVDFGMTKDNQKLEIIKN